jgi:hypothetical protein
LQPALSPRQVKLDDTVYDVAFLGTPQTVHLLRIKVPNVSSNMQKEEFEAVDIKIQLLKEHGLSVLRLLYEKDVSLHPMIVWNYVNNGEPPNLAMNVQEKRNDSWQFPKAQVTNAFAVTLNCRNELKLLTDSLDRRIPLQYRYLSLYKLFEITYFKYNKPSKDFDSFLAPYEGEFATSFPGKKSLKGYIIDLRARCAHITVNKGAMGVTMLNNKDASEVEAFLPFAYRIASEIINQYSGNAGLSILPGLFHSKL